MKNSINIFSETGCIPHDVLWKYRQGKLTASEKHAVEVHLTDCELCSDALAGMLNLQSDEMMEGLRKSARKISAPKKVIRFYDYRILSAAAAVAGLVIVSTYVINSLNKDNKKEIAQVIVPKKPGQESKKNEEPAPVSNLNEPTFKAKDTSVVKKQSENNSKKINSNLNQAIASNAIRTPSLPTTGNGLLSSIADTEKRAEPAAEKNVTLNVEDVSANQTGTYSAVAPTQTAAPVGKAIAADKDEKKTFASVQTKRAAKKSIVDSSSVTYFNDLKLSRTPAMTESEKFDSVNTGTPSMFENAQSKTTEPIGREMPFVYSKTLHDAMNFFHNGQYAEASQNFSIILDRLPNDVNAQFYKGLSEMELQNYVPASELLNKAMLNTDKTFFEEAKYKLALCYIALDKKDDAEKLLQQVVAEKGFYVNKASEKLKQLK